MLSIGEFARYAQVSPRMLRHYDAIGLLVPAHVDPDTGYRSYAAAQFSRVHRLCALKELGFPLEQIGPVLDDEVGAEGLRGMLLLRRSQIAEQMALDEERLASIERRLRLIESETTMSDVEYVEKPVPALRVAQVTASVEEQKDIGPRVGPMFDSLFERLPAAGVSIGGPPVAWYLMEGDRIQFGAGVPVTVESVPVDGVEVADLPASPRALTMLHHGSMEGIGQSWQALHQEIESRGLTPSDAAREVYHEAPMDDPDAWVTELQQPVT